LSISFECAGKGKMVVVGRASSASSSGDLTARQFRLRLKSVYGMLLPSFIPWRQRVLVGEKAEACGVKATTNAAARRHMC
jgi:hypothetical protein